MTKGFDEKTCPRCDYSRLKRWNELTGDEKILAARLPQSFDFSAAERETHLFCPRCWHEEAEKTIENC